MKMIAFFAVAILSSGAAFAGSANSGQSAAVQSCSDPRLMVRFATSAEAAPYCNQFNSEYYQVGTTYDYGYGQYTCSCYWTGSQGGR